MTTHHPDRPGRYCPGNLLGHAHGRRRAGDPGVVRRQAGAVGPLGGARSPVFAIAEPSGADPHARRLVAFVLGTSLIQDASVDPGYVLQNGRRLDGRVAFDGPK